MVQYARADTHYLLYIYDCVRAQLLDFNHGQHGLLQSVWNKSKDISLKVSTSLILYILNVQLTVKHLQLYCCFSAVLAVLSQFLLRSVVFFAF